MFGHQIRFASRPPEKSRLQLATKFLGGVNVQDTHKRRDSKWETSTMVYAWDEDTRLPP